MAHHYFRKIGACIYQEKEGEVYKTKCEYKKNTATHLQLLLNLTNFLRLSLETPSPSP
jgi:hypothetical protein